MIKIQDLTLKGRRVLIRADLNVAVENGDVKSEERIRASLDTVNLALDAGASVLIMSHFGRPREGEFEERYSLAPVARKLQQMMGREVMFLRDWIDGVELVPGQVALCENVRFLEGEFACSDSLSRQMARLCDIYVMDAFGAAHRNQTSLTGIVRFAPLACAGLLFQHEIASLNEALLEPARPVVSIVGGAKIDGKLQALKKLSKISDILIVGGGIANTFLEAAGYSAGNSLCQPELIHIARKLIQKAARRGCTIPLPLDVVVAPDLDSGVSAQEKTIDKINDEDMILDVGSATLRNYCAMIEGAGTIIWNGPLGVFEISPFDAGTRAIAQAVARSSAYSVAGGGDTLAALEQYELLNQVSFASTGGGAFLEYIKGKPLPAIAALEEHADPVRYARIAAS